MTAMIAVTNSYASPEKLHRILLKIRSQLSIQFCVTGAQRMRLLKERFYGYREELSRISGSRTSQQRGNAALVCSAERRKLGPH